MQGVVVRGGALRDGNFYRCHSAFDLEFDRL
jgi:hypothetical protein